MVDAGVVARAGELHPNVAGFAPATFERNKTVRIESFSDGVFAIAATLLVLGITVPRARDLAAGGDLGTTLLKMWPQYLAFVTSFITILAKWVNHHRIFSFIQRTDHPFAGTYVGIAFAFKGMWHHASRGGRLLARNVDCMEIRQITLQYRYGPPMYLVALALSFVSVGMSVVLCLCLAVFFASKGWPTIRALGKRPPLQGEPGQQEARGSD